MSVITQKNILNIVPGMSAPLVVHVSQGDSGVELVFTLVDGDEIFDPTGTVISVHGIRQDGVGWGPVACARENGNIKFTLPDAATAVKGSGMAEVVISNESETVGTTNFAILVETATFPQGVTYANDVSVYEAILAYVQNMSEQTVANVEADLAAEIANRQAADAVLQGEINTNANNINTNANNIITTNGRIDSLNEALATKASKTELQTEAEIRADSILIEKAGREAADANLQTQIDEIIAPSGEAPSAAEVQNARIGANSFTYPTLGDAIRAQIDNSNGRIDDITEDSRNLFDKRTIIPGTISSDGTISSSATLSYSDFIDVQSGAFTLSFAAIPSDGVIRIAYYDSNKDFISREVVSIGADVRRVYRKTNTYKYIRVIIVNAFAEYLQVELGFVTTDYVEHRVAKDVKNREDLADLENMISENTYNLFDKCSIIPATIDNDGVMSQSETLWTSDFIDVQSGAFNLSWETNPSDNYIRICYYNASKEFINREVVGIGADVRSVVRPTNQYKYLRLVCINGFEDGLQLKLGIVKSDYVGYRTALDYVARNILNDSKEKSYNLFNRDTITAGTISAEGAISSSAELWYSDFIDVKNGAFTLSYSEQPYDKYIRIAYYDENKNFISRSAHYDIDNVLTDFINTSKYIRLICYMGFEDVLQVELGIEATKYQPYVIYQKSNERVLHYNVCIVGGGAAGVSAAFALKDSGLKVCLIEKGEFLGGTHTQGWVDTLIPAFTPPFFDTLARTMVAQGKANLSIGEHDPLTTEESLAANWESTHRYTDGAQYNINIDPRAFSLEYYKELNANIDIMLGKSVVKASEESGKVKNVSLDDGTIIEADQFIDCSATNVILASLNKPIYYGGDSKTRYYSEYGFSEADAADNNYMSVNMPSLMYRITLGTENLDDIVAAYADWGGCIMQNSDPKYIYIICFYTEFLEKVILLDRGIKATYDFLKNKEIKHWKTIKYGTYFDGIFPHDKEDYKFDSVAPMLGIRELGRAKCERMLHESDLMVPISNSSLNPSIANLDKIIAIGNHHVDIYADPYITSAIAAEISSHITNYGVPFGCLIPKGLTNILVASKAYGATHIAQSCFRLTKHMMQIGSAAGFAAKIYAEDELSDFRNVDVAKLQSASYTNVVGMVEEALS